MEAAEKIKNLKQKLSIKKQEQEILMDILNIPLDDRNFVSLRKRVENLKKEYVIEKERAEILENTMPLTDPENSFKCHHFENGCKEEFLNKKVHEISCTFQKVLCPSLNCKQLLIANDMDVHLDQDHKILKVNAYDEWFFEGSKDELVKIVCSLKSCHQKFFPQMYIKDGNLYFKVVMFGLQERVIDFKACFTFFQGNGKDYNVGESVYPMTKNEGKEDFSIVSLKKLTEYYDSKSMKFKHQDNVRFSLKIINVKFDKITKEKKNFHEIAKEKENSQKTAKILKKEYEKGSQRTQKGT